MVARKQRQRAVQQRAEDTQEAILTAALELFSTLGYDGTSIRAIEQASGTNRGLVIYHFESKEKLWKAVVDRVFSRLPSPSDETHAVLEDLDRETQARARLTGFIRASAKHPELGRIMAQEGRSRSWRLDYLLENVVRPRVELFNKLIGHEADAHTLYIFIGAATMAFQVEAECESLFGINPRDDEFVREHAKRVCDLILGSGSRQANGD